MKFADPSFLYALSLVAIPILIHFLHFKRYKTVYFSQVNFLRTLLNESRKKNNLKQLIMLLCRILTLAGLVFAFAQPYIPLNSSATLSTNNTVGIYIDNSFSMNSQSGNGSLLELAKTKAIELANSFSPGTNFLLLTNKDTPNQRLSLNKEQLVSRIAQLKSSASTMDLAKAIRVLQNEMLTRFPGTNLQIYLLSDFQKRFADLGQPDAATAAQVYLLPFQQSEMSNLRIDTCKLAFPGRLSEQLESLTVRITNQSAKACNNVPLRLYVNDSLKALTAINLKAGESMEQELSYQNQQEGIQNCRVELDDYPITYDNTFLFSYELSGQIRALAISREGEEASQWLEKLFDDGEEVALDKMDEDRLQLSRFSDYQCIYLLNLPEIPDGLQHALSSYVNNGGSLVMFPGGEIDRASYNRLLSTLKAARLEELQTTKLKIDQLNLQNHLFNEVFTRQYDRLDLPEIRSSYQSSVPVQSSSSAVLTTNDGSVALREFEAGQGRLYLFNFPLTTEATNFYQHPLFVPLIYNMSLHSYFPQTIQYRVYDQKSLSVTLHHKLLPDLPISLSNYASGFNVQLPATSINNAQIRFNPDDFIHTAGFYRLTQGEKIIAPLAFNYNRNESDMRFYSSDELREMIAEIPAYQLYNTAAPDWLGQYDADSNLIELWKYFLLAALFFAIAELVIIRWWK
ncbi:BatA and WFA domain-containing protein [Mangrovibacterium marinum]|uniref:Putative membrane protein (TIGR02226 family) n=1 Tax=Mangrovibacterium marinum TaxID=1639118 RepID=A0A2T5BY70_9BACT|nr:BatA and WFA domain-containing protein [Mangrovibacterium marinum]PTN06771.1 putative membrane protein (TIGR02226 family) [Mangrovibacterium marinum]